MHKKSSIILSFVFFFVILPCYQIAAAEIKKYDNANLIIIDKLSQNREEVKIPVNSTHHFSEIILAVNSCFKLNKDIHDFVSSVTIDFSKNISGEVADRNLMIYAKNPHLGERPSYSLLDIILIDCDSNNDGLIMNKIQAIE